MRKLGKEALGGTEYGTRSDLCRGAWGWGRQSPGVARWMLAGKEMTYRTSLLLSTGKIKRVQKNKTQNGLFWLSGPMQSACSYLLQPLHTWMEGYLVICACRFMLGQESGYIFLHFPQASIGKRGFLLPFVRNHPRELIVTDSSSCKWTFIILLTNKYLQLLSISQCKKLWPQQRGQAMKALHAQLKANKQGPIMLTLLSE